MTKKLIKKYELEKINTTIKKEKLYLDIYDKIYTVQNIQELLTLLYTLHAHYYPLFIIYVQASYTLESRQTGRTFRIEIGFPLWKKNTRKIEYAYTIPYRDACNNIKEKKEKIPYGWIHWSKNLKLYPRQMKEVYEECLTINMNEERHVGYKYYTFPNDPDHGYTLKNAIIQCKILQLCKSERSVMPRASIDRKHYYYFQDDF